MAHEYDDRAEWEREINGRWELGEHDDAQHRNGPSMFYIYTRHGKRKDDRKTVTALVTWTAQGYPSTPLKIEYFRRLGQKIVDDHNKELTDE